MRRISRFRTRRIVVTVLAAGATCLAFGLPAAVAATAAPLTPSSTTTGTASSDFGWVSDASLSANPALKSQLHLTVASALTTVQPNDSGKKCSGSVCMNVYGTGLHVTNITTQAIGNQGCIKASYEIHSGTGGSGTLIRAFNSPNICPSSGSDGVYYANFHTSSYGMPVTCAGTSTASAGWQGYGSVPTATIHK